MNVYCDRLDHLIARLDVKIIAPTHGLPITDVKTTVPKVQAGLKAAALMPETGTNEKVVAEAASVARLKYPAVALAAESGIAFRDLHAVGVELPDVVRIATPLPSQAQCVHFSPSSTLREKVSMRKELALLTSIAALFTFIAFSAQAMPAAPLRGRVELQPGDSCRRRLRPRLASRSVRPLPPQLSSAFNANLARVVRAKFFAVQRDQGERG